MLYESMNSMFEERRYLPSKDCPRNLDLGTSNVFVGREVVLHLPSQEKSIGVEKLCELWFLEKLVLSMEFYTAVVLQAKRCVGDPPHCSSGRNLCRV